MGANGATRRFLFSGVLWLVLCSAALARELRLPVTFDFALLRQTLVAELYTGPNRTAQIWQDEAGCSELVLSNPQVGGEGRHLRILSLARARFGNALGGQCTPWLDWQGQLEIFSEASVHARGREVALRVVESNLYPAEGHRVSIATKFWDRIKPHVHPRLERVGIDLHTPLQALEETLPLLLPRQASGQAVSLLATVTPVAVQVKDNGIEVDFALALPERPPSPAPTPPEPVLTASELARWEAAWQHWDAFLTHVIKQAARDTALADFRLALLEVLIGARYDLVAALTEAEPGQPDPVRALFLRTWERLSPVLRELSAELSGEGTLRYLSFIAAVDALRALDALGPDVGLEISADGLRRLARILAPSAGTDPLAYVTAVDPELRQLFGFGQPLPLRRDNSTQPIDWLIPIARASPSTTTQLASRLDRWVPTKAEISVYLPLVHMLLDQAAQEILISSKLKERYRALYQKLVLATAWQESCWRQFIRKQGRVQALRSGAGSVGIMQINVRVWRGFYEPSRLETDIAYNARAGAEILAHYLVDYAIKKGEHLKTGRPVDLARATYAVYNGGPSHLRRYRQSKTSSTLKEIDEAFWNKYQRIAQGDELAVASCFGLSTPFAPRTKGAALEAEPNPAATAKVNSVGSEPGQVASLDSSAGGRWLLRQDPRHFTLQLVAAQDEQAIRDYLADHGLGDGARYFAFQRQAKIWFAAVYGVYATRAEAEAAAKGLARKIDDSPWIRPLSDVHEAIRESGTQG